MFKFHKGNDFTDQMKRLKRKKGKNSTKKNN